MNANKLVLLFQVLSFTEPWVTTGLIMSLPLLCFKNREIMGSSFTLVLTVHETAKQKTKIKWTDFSANLSGMVHEISFDY